MAWQLCERKLEQQSQMSQYVRWRADRALRRLQRPYYRTVLADPLRTKTSHYLNTPAAQRLTDWNYLEKIWWADSNMLPACWQGKRTNISFDQTKDISCLGCRTNSSRSLKAPNDFLIQAILLMLRSHDRMSQYALFSRNCTTKRSPTSRCSSLFEHFTVIFLKSDQQ